MISFKTFLQEADKDNVLQLVWADEDLLPSYSADDVKASVRNYLNEKFPDYIIAIKVVKLTNSTGWPEIELIGSLAWLRDIATDYEGYNNQKFDELTPHRQDEILSIWPGLK